MRDWILCLLCFVAVFLIHNSTGFGTLGTDRMLRERLIDKVEMLAAIRQSIETVKANPPMCGGRPMVYTPSQKTNQQISALEQEIGELREALRERQ